MKKYLHIIIAVALAIAAGVFVWIFVNVNTPSVNVVIATARMPVGVEIRESHITTKLAAKSVLPDGALTNPADAVGKTLAYAVLEGDIIRQEHIAAGKGSLAARLIAAAPGKVAVDLPPEAAQGLSGLTIGDVVNIYGDITVIYGNGQAGNSIEKVAEKAVIISAPPTGAKEKSAIIIACDPAEEQRIAQVLSNNKKVTLFLLPGEAGKTGDEGGDAGDPENEQHDPV